MRSRACAAATFASPISNADTASSRWRWLTALFSNKRHDAVALAARLVALRDRDRELRPRLRRGGTERLRVDAEQHLALADPLPSS